MDSIDLHGKTWAEALSDIIDVYNRMVQQGAGSRDTLDIVHGYGASGTGGSMRVRIRSFLSRHSDRLEYVSGEDLDGNPGHTVVMPIRSLPGSVDLLAEKIWEYCDHPRTVKKITGQFRRDGDPKVQQAIRTLEKQSRLRAVYKGREKAYQAT